MTNLVRWIVDLYDRREHWFYESSVYVPEEATREDAMKAARKEFSDKHTVVKGVYYG